MFLSKELSGVKNYCSLNEVVLAISWNLSEGIQNLRRYCYKILKEMIIHNHTASILTFSINEFTKGNTLFLIYLSLFFTEHLRTIKNSANLLVHL